MKIYVDCDGIRGLFERAENDGRSFLYEQEVYELVRLIGSETVPRYVLVPKGARLEPDRVSAIPGDRIVIKAVSPFITHKSDAGAVRIVPKEPEALLSAVRAMTYEVPESFAALVEREPGRAPEAYRGLEGDALLAAASRDLKGMLLVQYMPASQQFGSELIVSLRRTREFGMILSAGLGGTDTELYAESFRKGQAVVAASTAMTDGETFFRLFRNTISYKALAGLMRGHRRIVTDEQLLECFAALIALGNHFSPLRPGVPYVIEELEINPFAFSNYLMFPLDGLCRFSRPGEMPAPRPVEKIDRLLHPSTIALVGASSREMNVGRIILNNILANGFDASRLRVVHPAVQEIEGVQAASSLDALGTKVDLLILAVGTEQAAALAGQVLERNLAESVLLIPGGMGEVHGTEDRCRELQKRIRKARQRDEGGPVFLGGNSLGILSHPGRYDSLFIPDAKLPKHRGEHARRSAFISQSGAYMITRMSKLSFMDPAYALSIGNQIDLTASDIVRFIDRDEEIRTIACYMEGFNDLDGLEFSKAVRHSVLQGKEVLFYKAGRTPEGKSASAGHTASLAGDYMVCESCVSQAGAMVADTFTAFEGLLRLSSALSGKAVSGNRLAAVSNAGYESVGIADNILGEDFHLELAGFTEETRKRLARILREARIETLVEVKNPIDLTPMADEGAYEAVIEALLEDPLADAVVAAVVPLTPLIHTLPREIASDDPRDLEKNIAGRIARLAARSPKPLVVVVDSGALYDPLASAFEQGGIPVFRSADQAVWILGKYVRGRLRAEEIRAGRG
ncbi:MAG: acetate--CoA ligase family protein [bacterium]